MHYTIMSVGSTSVPSLIFHTEYLIIMNLSIFKLAYLGSQAKDTPHSGQNQILRFGNAQIVAETTDDIWMRQLGILPQPDWPLARLLWAGEPETIRGGVQDIGSCNLLLAQPVHLSLQRDSFALDSLLELSGEEYLSLTTHLNNFFIEEGLTFIPSSTQQYWYLKTSSAWQLTTASVQTAFHQNIQAWMPQGQDASKLRQIINQVQMLLHEHPLNLRRSQQGVLEINSIWFSRNSAFEQVDMVLPQQNTVLIGQNALIKAISETYKLPYFADISGAINAGAKDVIMLFDHTNSVSWDDIYNAVRARKIQQMTAHFPIVNSTLQVSLMSLDCWKFWRKPSSFESIFSILSKQAKH